MQPTDIHGLIQGAISDDQVLPRLSREIGRELPLNRWGILDEIRSALDQASRGTGDYARGVLEGLAEVVRAYQAEVLPREQDQRMIALARQRGWGPALQAMANGPVLPTELRTQLGEAELSSVSRLLKDMRQVGLVDLFSSPGSDGRMRPHHLTLLGKRVLDGLAQAQGHPMTPAGAAPVREAPPVAMKPVKARRAPGSFFRLAKPIPQIERRSPIGS